jgi:hypothetical protein
LGDEKCVRNLASDNFKGKNYFSDLDIDMWIILKQS